MAGRGRPKKIQEGIPPEPEEVILTETKPTPPEENQLKCSHDSYHDNTPLVAENGVWKNGKWYCSPGCASYH